MYQPWPNEAERGVTIELRHLRYFVAVAQHLHFTRAAAALHVAQPALSQQLAQLERELGVALLDRARRHVSLTAAGEALLVRAERILAEVAHAEEEMHAFAGVLRGRVTLGTLAYVGAFRLPALLARFRARYPGVAVALCEEATQQLAALLAAGHVDLALVHVTEDTLPPYLADPGLVTEALFGEDLVLSVAPAHPLAGRASVALADLHDESFVAFKAGSGLRRTLERASAAAGFAPRIVFESGDLGTICGLVAAGGGVTIIPRSVALTHHPTVALVPISAPSLARTVLLAWRDDRQRSPAAAACLAFIRADVAEHPWVSGEDVMRYTRS